ncbi:DUF5316 family protein [Gorillibacterium massiliense]|uniref:DUF5316 family protein n=1 Tax=Gorillibacterium massiliense TaxID=1280390 RepID=UPI0004AD4E86|nr:DUF5316 family protein [Gorillibacterium massiliense]
MKTFMWSIVSCLILSTAGYLYGGLSLALKVSFGIGLVVLIAAMLFSGTFGNSYGRENVIPISKEDRNLTIKWTDKLLLVCIPYLAVAVIIFILK